MRIRLKTLMSGPFGTHHQGEVLDIDPQRAAELLKGGFAEPADPPQDAPETAMVDPGEKAIKPRGRARK